MNRILISTFAVIAFMAVCFAEEDAKVAERLRSDLCVLQYAERCIQNAAGAVDAVGEMTKVIKDKNLAEVYEKWSQKKWAEFSKKIEVEIADANRRHRIPKSTTSAAEEMIAILEPNLKELQNKNSAMKKGDARFEDLQKQIDAQQKKLDQLKKEAADEKEKVAEKIAAVVASRKEAFITIAKKVESEIENGPVIQLLVKLKPVEDRLKAQKEINDARVMEEYMKKLQQKVEEENARIALERKAEIARREKEQRELDALYREKKAWYDYQLDYNGLHECSFYLDPTIAGPCYLLQLQDSSYDFITIQYCTDSGELSWPRCIVKGFAEDLLLARIIIYRYENPDWKQKYEQMVMRRKKSEADEERAEKRKSSFKSYTPKKRRINPDLKRFKGPRGL